MRIRSILTLYILLFLIIHNTVTFPIRINRGYVLSGITLMTSLALLLSKTPITIQDANFEQSICTEKDVTTDTLAGITSIGIILFLAGRTLQQIHAALHQNYIDHHTDRLSQHIANDPA